LAALDRPVVLVSHRGPVTFAVEDGERTTKRGSGGLVSALMGLAGHLSDAIWVYAASSEEDRQVMTEAKGKAMRLALAPQARLVEDDASVTEHEHTIYAYLVDVPERQHEDFYSVISNPLLWFVQHGLYGLAQDPVLTERTREAFEDGYVPVNDQFSDVVVEQVRAVAGDRGRAIVMIHDYHFYLLAERVRAACPEALITQFIHIPWPSPNDWRILPPYMRERLLRGLLGNDVVAFHTLRDARNFLLCAADILDLSIDLGALTITVGERKVGARHYPISVNTEALRELAGSADVRRHAETLRRDFLTGGRQMVLRVDRTDPSKNIVRGFRAFDVLLSDHPELAGQVVFFALLQPSRQDVPEYADYISALGGVVAEVNARHGRDGWQPVQLRLESDLALAVAAYTVCDVLLVNAVRDGMNLVAKEAVLVSERDMVLVLSETTGAFDELSRYAVRAHPFDIQQQADAMYEALTMDVDRRRAWLREAAAIVRHNDVERWLDMQLRDLLRLDEDR
jgi:trehalose 6-phosphate synthase